MAVSEGPFDLSKPAWVWEEPNRRLKGSGVTRVFHSSPIIDGEYNTYIQSTTGWVYSISKAGGMRWEFNTGDGNPGNLALQDGVLYTINDAGVAFAIDAGEGRELWRRKVAEGAPADTHSLVVYGDMVLTACNPDAKPRPFYLRDVRTMSHGVCALDTKDGHLIWFFDQIAATRRDDAVTCNQLPAIVGDAVLFSDSFGGVYKVALADGTLRWYSPASTDMERIVKSKGMFPWGTTGGMVVGPNDRAYHAFNEVGGLGKVECHNIHDGSVVWQMYFPRELNAAPAVGTLYGLGEKLAVVVAPGANPEMEPLGPVGRLAFQLGLTKSKATAVFALDAGNGMTLWRFEAPAWAGVLQNNDLKGLLYCAPDTWGNPSIGSDGTVYVNWSGGRAFALRDANGDGVVDPNDPKEVSSYYHGLGTNGATAIAPGYIVAPTCKHIIAWSS